MRERDLSDPVYRRRLAGRLVSGARSRAARRGVSCTIEPEDVERLLKEQNMRCAVSGLNFSFKVYPTTVKHPFGPSIDRERSSGGYDPGNVRLVCAAANFGLGDGVRRCSFQSRAGRSRLQTLSWRPIRRHRQSPYKSAWKRPKT